jgi:Family of unknown function (DUF6951)
MNWSGETGKGKWLLAIVKVESGICGFHSTIRVKSEDMQNAVIQFETDCPNLKQLEQELTEADSFGECFSKVGESNVFEQTKKYCKHAACPVPTAIIKGIEVACGLALPKDVLIKISKEDN